MLEQMMQSAEKRFSVLEKAIWTSRREAAVVEVRGRCRSRRQKREDGRAHQGQVLLRDVGGR